VLAAHSKKPRRSERRGGFAGREVAGQS
jgi:hypothetical protein